MPVYIEEVKQLWGEKFFEECQQEALELRKTTHPEADLNQITREFTLTVAIAKLGKRLDSLMAAPSKELGGCMKCGKRSKIMFGMSEGELCVECMWGKDTIDG